MSGLRFAWVPYVCDRCGKDGAELKVSSDGLCVAWCGPCSSPSYVFAPNECDHEKVDGFAGDQWCRDCGELLDDISEVDL